MSLLSPKQVRLFLGQSEVTGVRLSGWHPRVVQKCRTDVVPAQGGAPWQSYGAAVEAATAELSAGRSPVTVTLSSHHTRYRLLPWDDALANDQEERAIARHHFVTDFGAAASRAILHPPRRQGEAAQAFVCRLRWPSSPLRRQSR